MKTILIVMLLGSLLGIAHNVIVDPGIGPPSEAVRNKSDGNPGPEEVVREYVRAATLCDVDATAALTIQVPDDYVVKLKKGDRSVLVADIKTPTGPRSDADAYREVYRKWVVSEFPDFVCKFKLQFGNTIAIDETPDRADISINFLTTEGEFRYNWIIRLIKTKGDWKIYDVEAPDRVPEHLRAKVND